MACGLNFEELLVGISEVALLADARQENFPIVGASVGFRQLTGHSFEHMLGLNLPETIVNPEGLPSCAVSLSTTQDFASFCRTCRRQEVQHIGEIEAMLPGVRHDGSFFMSIVSLGLCKIGGHSYILAVQHPFADGLSPRLNKGECRAATNMALDSLRRVQMIVLERGDCPEVTCESNSVETRTPTSNEHAVPDFALFGERLQHHSIISGHGYRAERREAAILPRGCLVFSDKPVKLQEEGLCFRCRVDGIAAFKGFPVVGFTKRKPVDDHEVFPAVAKCLGSSILVGAEGASARDNLKHYEMGFKAPAKEEVEMWSVPVQHKSLEHERRLCEGDVISCIYTPEGRIQFWISDIMTLDFDVGRPIDVETQYYAVVDVSFEVSSLTVLPWQHPSRAIEENSYMKCVVPTTQMKTLDLPAQSVGDLSIVVDFGDVCKFSRQASIESCSTAQSLGASSGDEVDLDTIVADTLQSAFSRRFHSYTPVILLGVASLSLMVGFRHALRSR